MRRGVLESNIVFRLPLLLFYELKIYPQAKWNIPWRKFSSHCKNFDILKYSIQVIFSLGFACVAFTQDLFLFVNFLLVNSLNLPKIQALGGKEEERWTATDLFAICVYICTFAVEMVDCGSVLLYLFVCRVSSSIPSVLRLCHLAMCSIHLPAGVFGCSR